MSKIPADLAATYANFAIITHSPWEFFLRLCADSAKPAKARVRARIVLAPANAKMLLRALQENVARYEAQHGEIKVPERPPSLADQLFSSIRSDDADDTPPEGAPDHE
jgi:hypothetical protein